MKMSMMRSVSGLTLPCGRSWGIERPCGIDQRDGRFETQMLATEENLKALADLSGLWVDRVHERAELKTLVLDMDSSDSPTHGHQEGSTFNGHFGFTCYHPLFVFKHFGGLERAMLRPGIVHGSEGMARSAGARGGTLPGTETDSFPASRCSLRAT